MAAVLQYAYNSAASTKVVANVSTRAGDLIIVGFAYDEAMTTATCSDNQNGSYTQFGTGLDLATPNPQLICMHLFYRIATEDAIVTVTVTSTAVTYTQVVVHVVSGMHPTQNLVLRGASWGGLADSVGTSHATETFNAQQEGDYIFTWFAQDAVGNTMTSATAGYTKCTEVTGTVISTSFYNIATASDALGYISQYVNSSASAAYGNIIAAFALAPAPPVIGSFTASPAPIPSGSSSTLSWSTSGTTTSRTIDQGIGAIAASGTRSVSPTVSTTYTLSTANANGTTQATVYVGIAPAGKSFQSDAFQSDAFQMDVTVSYDATQMFLMF